MPSNKIYLGIDMHSNLSVSLEAASGDVYYIAVSNGPAGEDLCKFLCTDEDLNQVLHNVPYEVQGHAGRCSIHAAGDVVVVEFQRTSDFSPSSVAIAVNSFLRVLKLIRGRAYLH